MSKLPTTCIGYGSKEGLCYNATGAKSQTGRKNPYWCPTCDKDRIAAIGSQFDDLAKNLDEELPIKKIKNDE